MLPQIASLEHEHEPEGITAPPESTDATPTPEQAKKAPRQHVGCSLVRIANGDKAEEMFVRSLSAFRPAEKAQEKSQGNQPRLFLVFGRGRMLGPMIGEQIIEENIQSAASFLTGPCMCEIKAQNPGVDLLMNLDWDTALDTFASRRSPEGRSGHRVPRRRRLRPKIQEKQWSR